MIGRSLPFAAPGRRLAIAICVTVAALGLLSHGNVLRAEEEKDAPASRELTLPSWSDEIQDLFGRIPVQDDGRVKPLSTWARFQLLHLNHKSSCETSKGEKRSPMEWLLDCFFYPHIAIDHAVILVENDAVLKAIELTFEEKRKKRDRYSFNEIAGAREKLFETNREIHALMKEEHLEFEDLSSVQKALLVLGSDFRDYEDLLHFFDFGRNRIKVPEEGELRALFGGEPSVYVSEILTHASGLDQAFRSANSEPARTVRWGASTIVRGSRTLRILPPPDVEAQDWTTPAEVVAAALRGDELSAEHVTAIRQLERLTAAIGEEGPTQEAARAYLETVVGVAKQRGEYSKVDLEVRYYSLNPFGKGALFYLFGFVLLAVSWLGFWRPWIYRVALVLLGTAFLWHTLGIVMRSVLRGRPPVLNLYDTVVFIGAVAVLACFIIELINRRRVAIVLAPVLGALSVVLASGYEELNRQDTVHNLMAVLDTDFWLITHVICISIGYAAGLLTGAFAHVYVFARMFGVRGGQGSFYTDLGKMMYGALCFALVFTVVGTILGGIWANESWGRFWGWDPKENGALLICIWQVITLHARLAGHVRLFGTAVLNVFGTVVIAFSWWHVNNMGIGLHSYGRTSGILQNLYYYYGLEAGIILAAVIWWISRNLARPASE